MRRKGAVEGARGAVGEERASGGRRRGRGETVGEKQD